MSSIARLTAFSAVFAAGLAMAQNDSDLEKQVLLSAETSAKAIQKQREVQKGDVEDELKVLDDSVKGPHSVPLEHILVVQYRYIRKEGAHEFTPLMIGVQPADSFRRQITWGFGYAYHVSEDFGVEVLHATFTKNFSTGLSDTIYNKFKLFIDRKESVFSLGSSLLWTPLKSKAATIDDINYFEGYFLGGGGFTRYENKAVGMAMAGVGFRAYITQKSLFKLEVRDYMDFIASKPDHRLNVIVGATVLLGGDEK